MKLSRRATIGLMASATIASPTFARAKFEYDLVPIAIGQDIWMIQGSTEYFSSENGGAIVNCVLVKTDAGMVIFDTGSSLRYGQALMRLANGLSGFGVAAVVNTHHHPDHFFGNQVFRDLPIYSLPETQALAGTHGDGYADNLYRLLGDWMRGTEAVPPNTSLNSSVLDIGGRRFNIIPMAGHSEADLVVLDTMTGTLIAGDIAFLDRAPTTPSADITVWKQSLDILEGIDASAIVPGHGPLDVRKASINQTRGYLTWLEKTLLDAANQGQDMVEIMGANIPVAYNKMGSLPQEFHRSIAHLYPKIEATTLPLGD